MVAEAVGLGLVISLIFSEAFGLAAGGMVVPGYIALYMNQPTRIIGTLVVSLTTYLVFRLISSLVIVYGRRRLVLVVLIGFIFGYVSRQVASLKISQDVVGLEAIGYIIPGLIANWMEQQGVVETVTTMIMAGVIVRMALVLIHGGGLLEVALW